jgi:hypothetical protein
LTLSRTHFWLVALAVGAAFAVACAVGPNTEFAQFRIRNDLGVIVTMAYCADEECTHLARGALWGLLSGPPGPWQVGPGHDSYVNQTYNHESPLLIEEPMGQRRCLVLDNDGPDEASKNPLVSETLDAHSGVFVILMSAIPFC